MGEFVLRHEMVELTARRILAEDFPRPLGSPIGYRLRRNSLHCKRIYVRADAFLGRYRRRLLVFAASRHPPVGSSDVELQRRLT